MIPGGTAHVGVSAPPGAVSHVTDVQIASLAYNAGWRGNDTVIAIAVCLAESGGNVDSSFNDPNGTTDYGLWQVNSVHFNESGWSSAWIPPELLLPSNNAAAAYHVWQSSGWGAWSTYASGRYLAYMTRAKAAYVSSGASTARGNINIPTSFSVLGINTPNWLGGFSGTSVLGVGASAAQSVSDFFKNFSLMSFIKILGGGLLLLIGIYILIKAY